MKAWVLHEVGDIRFEDVDRPELMEDEVLVSVKAVGICGSDIPRIYQTGAHRMPLIPGHEFAGEVVQTASAADNALLGERVGIFPLIPCKKCRPCRQLKYEMCRAYSYLGSRTGGGFAEYVAVPRWNLVRLPQNVSFEEAAMLEPMAVAVHAMRRIEPTEKACVVVCGLGTIGQLLVMFLRERGVQNLLVIGNKEFQKQKVLKMGLSEANYCDVGTQDVREWLMGKTEGYGADVFFECVGQNKTAAQAVDLTAPSGRICMVGNPHSDMLFMQDIYWKILRHQLTITGSWNSSYFGDPALGCADKAAEDDWQYVVRKLEQKSVDPAAVISHRFSLEDLDKGFHIMRDKTEDYIKIMATRMSDAK